MLAPAARAHLRLACCAALCTAAGCAQLLGFEPAELDPASVPVAEALRGGAPDAGAPPTQCEEYCDTVIAACGPDGSGRDYSVYDSRFTCLYQCALLPVGAAGDEAGNSVACRLNAARVALQFPGERPSACPAAGPGGDGVCGNNCDGYCTLMSAECPGFFDAAGCAASCAASADLGGFDTSRIEGDSVQCRLYHLQAASVSPVNHCVHAAGAFPCGPL